MPLSRDAESLLWSDYLQPVGDSPEGTHGSRKWFYVVLGPLLQDSNSFLIPADPTSSFSRFTLLPLAFHGLSGSPGRPFTGPQAPQPPPQRSSTRPTPVPPAVQPTLAPRRAPSLTRAPLLQASPLPAPQASVPTQLLHRKCTRGASTRHSLPVLGQRPVSRTVTSPLPEAAF